MGDGSRFWRTDEIRTLREHFPAGGADACAPLLPGRSVNAIKAQACRLGLLAPKVERPSGWFHSRITPEIRTELLLLAGKTVSWKRVKALAAKWRMTPQGALRRLQYAGAKLAPTKIPWTVGQDAVLRDLSDRPVQAIAQQLRRATGIRRTPNAVYVRMQRLGVAGRTDLGGYSANELSRLLGVSNSTIWHRIANGTLPATRRPGIVPRGAQSPWLVKPADIKRMLRDDERLLTRARRKGDALWLADLLGELGRGQGQCRTVDYGGLAEHHLGMEVAA